MDADAPTGRWRRGAVIAAAIGGVFYVASGLWAFAAPQSFFDAAATFEPYNAHFIRDIGAFQIGLGAVLLLAIRVRDGLTVVLVGVGVGSLVHAVGHYLDRDLGGTPEVDIPFLTLLAVALLAVGVLRSRS